MLQTTAARVNFERNLDVLVETRENAACCQKQMRIARTAEEAAGWKWEYEQIMRTIRQLERRFENPEREAAALRRLAEMRSKAAARELASEIAHAEMMVASLGPDEPADTRTQEEREEDEQEYGKVW